MSDAFLTKALSRKDGDVWVGAGFSCCSETRVPIQASFTVGSSSLTEEIEPTAENLSAARRPASVRPAPYAHI